MNYYLAIDIGASSGRHMLCHLEDGKMILEEIYRFPNGMKKVDGSLCWDVPELFHHIKEGMKKCGQAGKIPVSMGIDTWAVDYVLLDDQDQIIGKTYGYRDSRTEGMDEEVYKKIQKQVLYAKTGIQKQIFNTIYQLMAVKKREPENLEKARTLLMIPDYFNFLLTGVKLTEYTNATTTQLVSPITKDWDSYIIDKLGYPAKIFTEISKPGSLVGRLTKEMEEEIGFNLDVVLPATHDTGSAVVAVPALEDQAMYISSGTWSLMGTELEKADCSRASMDANLTNEGGYDYRFRYLKNIMGLWMIQSVKKEFAQDHSFAEISDMASKQNISSIVDCNDQRFFAPESMIQAVKDYCQESGQQVPETDWEVAAVVYNSLGDCYARTIREIEALTKIHYSKIYVVGGGSNADYLNKVTAMRTGREVVAGPGEATALGNIAVQMIAGGELKDLADARSCIRRSFPLKKYSIN